MGKMCVHLAFFDSCKKPIFVVTQSLVGHARVSLLQTFIEAEMLKNLECTQIIITDHFDF